MSHDTAFLRESPLRRARRTVDADLLGKADPNEMVWLHRNPLMWLRALQCIDHDVKMHIGRDRASINHLKPEAGTSPSEEYLAAKKVVEEKTASRLHFGQLVDRQIQEVKALIAPGPIPVFLTMGDLIAVFTELAMLADEGSLEATADKAMWHAKRLKRIARSGEAQ